MLIYIYLNITGFEILQFVHVFGCRNRDCLVIVNLLKIFYNCSSELRLNLKVSHTAMWNIICTSIVVFMCNTINRETTHTHTHTHIYIYITISSFRYLSRWTAYFSRKQILIIDYKDLIKSPYDVVHQVETFLNLEHKIKPEMIYFDKHKEFYCKYTNLSKHIKTCMGGAKGRKHPKVPKEDVDKLKRFYKPWNEKWFNAVGHDFGWNDGVE